MSELDGGMQVATLEAGQTLEMAADTDAEREVQHDNDTALPEMPAGHADIDPATISVAGLTTKCKYFADLVRHDPALANRTAERTIQFKKQEAEMRQKGMDNEAIEKRQWSSMRERLKERVKAEEKPAAEKTAPETKTEPTRPLVPEQAIPDTTKVDEVVLTHAPESAPIPVVSREVIDKSDTQQTKAPQLPAPMPAKEAAAPVREPSEAPAVTEQSVDQTADAPRLDLNVDQAYAVAPAYEAPALASPDSSLPSQVAVATEVAPEQAIPVERPPIMRVEAIATTEYESPPSIATIDPLLHDDVLPEQVIPYASIDAAEIVPEDEVLLSPIDWSDLEYDETAEQTDTGALPKLEVVPAATPAESQEQTTWDHVLEQEPLEICEDFTEALQAAIALPEQALVSHEAPDVDEPALPIEAPQEVELPPAIAVTVTERLAELAVEEKEAVAPVMKEIIEAVQVFEVLMIAEAEPEVIETMHTELEELVINLFEQLGTVYEPEDVERFVAVLLRPDFQPLPSEKAATIDVDLEHLGTHEARLHFTQLVSGLADVEEIAKRLLGKLVLFYAAPQGTPEYEPVAA
jgi:hypothetical protein